VRGLDLIEGAAHEPAHRSGRMAPRHTAFVNLEIAEQTEV
jgi:hypothetical protein